VRRKPASKRSILITTEFHRDELPSRISWVKRGVLERLGIRLAEVMLERGKPLVAELVISEGPLQAPGHTEYRAEIKISDPK